MSIRTKASTKGPGAVDSEMARAKCSGLTVQSTMESGC